MAPKKKEQTKMSLGDFLTDDKLGSWADEMEDMPVYSRAGGYGGGERRTYSATTGYGNTAGGYSVREELPLPDKPPYTVHLGNLSFDATSGDVTEFFAECECVSVRIIEDKLEMKPKGFGYAEFGSLAGLKQALTLNGASFQGRNIRISVADPPKDRGDRPEAREITDWSRKGPLPDLPGRGGNDRRPSERVYQPGRNFGDAGGSDYGGERRERREPEGDGKIRDYGDWSRKGPLSPLPQTDRAPREGGRPGTREGVPKGEGFRDGRSPAAWGEGRPQGSQDGSRPPRREFQERPAVERAPTAADTDSAWRTKMKPDAPAASAPESRDGSEAPASPAVPAAPVGRPRLNLAKRTVTEIPADQPSPSSIEAKPSPFGGARPIDTAAKEKEIEEKRLAAIREKKEADDKAKADARDAAKAARVDADKQEDVEGEKKVEILQREEGTEETVETENANGDIVDDKAVKPKEILRDAVRPKPAETGAWRRPTGGPLRQNEEIPRGPRAAGGRGGGRGPGRHGDSRSASFRNGPASPALPTEPEVAPVDADGWAVVSKPKKNARGGGSQGQRPIAS